jgi:hypothetical protein
MLLLDILVYQLISEVSLREREAGYESFATIELTLHLCTMQLLPFAESLMFKLLPKSKIVLISGFIKGDLGSPLNLRAAAVNCTLFKAENCR